MKKVITFGEIMLRLSTPEYQRFEQAKELKMHFGGGEANVAVSLARFGIPVDYVSRIPENDIGKACINELKLHGVGVDQIIKGGDRLGLYFLEKGSVNRAGKVIYDRANSAMSEIKPGMVDWDKVFEGASWFHWSGISPAISQSAAEVCMEAIEKAKELNITVSCDLNFRKKLWNYGQSALDVMPELVKNCDIILGNEEDAEMTLGIKAEGVDINSENLDVKAYQSVSEQIMQRFPKVKKVITTLRGSVNANHNKWSGILFDGKTLFQAPNYEITHIVDRVGGGDAFMGGLIYGLISYQDDQKALNFATAASCLKHTIQGDFNYVTVDEVKSLMNGNKSGRVLR